MQAYYRYHYTVERNTGTFLFKKTSFIQKRKYKITFSDLLKNCEVFFLSLETIEITAISCYKEDKLTNIKSLLSHKISQCNLLIRKQLLK